MKTRAQQQHTGKEEEAAAGPSEPQVPIGVLTRAQRRKRPAEEPLQIPDVLPDQRGARKAARKQTDRVPSVPAAGPATADEQQQPPPSEAPVDLSWPASGLPKEPKLEPEAHTSRGRRASARAQPKAEEAPAAGPSMVSISCISQQAHCTHTEAHAHCRVGMQDEDAERGMYSRSGRYAARQFVQLSVWCNIQLKYCVLQGGDAGPATQARGWF